MSLDAEQKGAAATVLVVFSVGFIAGAVGTAALDLDLEDLLLGAFVVILIGGLATFLSFLKHCRRRDPSRGVGPWGA